MFLNNMFFLYLCIVSRTAIESMQLWYIYLHLLVGGFNSFENYKSNWIISPRIGVNIKKYLKPPSSIPKMMGIQKCISFNRNMFLVSMFKPRGGGGV